MLSKQQALFAKNLAKLITKINDDGNFCTMGESYRTPEQAALYEKQGKGIAKSLHCSRLAADLNLFSPDFKYQTAKSFYKPYGEYWESLHVQNRWGGRWTKLVDSNHFEMAVVD
jgi:hypothetical protein